MTASIALVYVTLTFAYILGADLSVLFLTWKFPFFFCNKQIPYLWIRLVKKMLTADYQQSFDRMGSFFPEST